MKKEAYVETTWRRAVTPTDDQITSPMIGRREMKNEVSETTKEEAVNDNDKAGKDGIQAAAEKRETENELGAEREDVKGTKRVAMEGRRENKDEAKDLSTGKKRDRISMKEIHGDSMGRDNGEENNHGKNNEDDDTIEVEMASAEVTTTTTMTTKTTTKTTTTKERQKITACMTDVTKRKLETTAASNKGESGRGGEEEEEEEEEEALAGNEKSLRGKDQTKGEKEEMRRKEKERNEREGKGIGRGERKEESSGFCPMNSMTRPKSDYRGIDYDDRDDNDVDDDNNDHGRHSGSNIGEENGNGIERIEYIERDVKDIRGAVDNDDDAEITGKRNGQIQTVNDDNDDDDDKVVDGLLMTNTSKKAEKEERERHRKRRFVTWRDKEDGVCAPAKRAKCDDNDDNNDNDGQRGV